MTGFLLLFLLAIWVALLWFIIRTMMKHIKSRKLAVSVSAIFSIFFMCLPVVDEIFGWIQFAELCKNNSLYFDDKKSINKIVFLQNVPEVKFDGYFLPIRKQTWSYADVTSKDVVLLWHTYYSDGGKLMQFLGISETHAPLIFNGVCRPKESGEDVFRKLNLTKKQRREVYDINQG